MPKKQTPHLASVATAANSLRHRRFISTPEFISNALSLAGIPGDAREMQRIDSPEPGCLYGLLEGVERIDGIVTGFPFGMSVVNGVAMEVEMGLAPMFWRLVASTPSNIQEGGRDADTDDSAKGEKGQEATDATAD